MISVFASKSQRIYRQWHWRLANHYHAVASQNRFMTATHGQKNKTTTEDSGDHWDENRVSGYFGHNFPDFVEHWNRDAFRKVGYILGASTGALAVSAATLSTTLAGPAVVVGALTTAYWRIGNKDMQQTSHAIRRNYPVLGNMRYLFETVRTLPGF
jgi:hypothetical protein